MNLQWICRNNGKVWECDLFFIKFMIQQFAENEFHVSSDYNENITRVNDTFYCNCISLNQAQDICLRVVIELKALITPLIKGKVLEDKNKYLPHPLFTAIANGVAKGNQIKIYNNYNEIPQNTIIKVDVYKDNFRQIRKFIVDNYVKDEMIISFSPSLKDDELICNGETLEFYDKI